MYNTAVKSQKEAYDAGLKSYMLSIYNNMMIAMLISGIVAYSMSTNQALMDAIWKTPLGWVVVFTPLVLSIGLAFVIERISPFAARMFLFVFAATMGASLSLIFMIYQMGSIFQVFFITSAMFGVTSLYGYTTKRDLSSMGTFLMMGLFGIIIAGVINIFLQSPALQFAVSMIAVIIFTGLTAYETQEAKDSYYTMSGTELEKFGVISALNLYMNFINLFIHLLQLLGEKISD
jgi:FtsH-binding integral membrane protein